MEFRKRVKKAAAKVGTATVRPQDTHRKFMLYLRNLNSGNQIWKDWPTASSETRRQILVSEFPTDFEVPNYIEEEMFNVKYVEVDTQVSFDEMMQDIKQNYFVSLDFEFHQRSSYNGLIAVIQVGTMYFNYVIDPFELRDCILKDFVPKVLQNSRLLKIMCGCANDVLYAQSNFQAFMIGVIDVQDIYHEWKLESSQQCFLLMKDAFKKHIIDRNAKKGKKSINVEDTVVEEEWRKPEPISYKKLVEALFPGKINIDKTEQLADFRVRPMTKFAAYAAQDVHFLYLVYLELLKMVSESALQSAFRKTKSKLMKTFKLQKYPGWEKSLQKLPEIKTDKEKGLFIQLHRWRDQLARDMDEGPDVIMSLKEMSSLCKLASSKRKLLLPDLKHILSKNSSSYTARQHGHLLAIINNDIPVLQAIRTMECHNCLLKGHQAWQCPFPVDKTALKQWMARAENRIFKLKQGFRRASNWYHKKGRWPNGPPIRWLELALYEDTKKIDPYMLL